MSAPTPEQMRELADEAESEICRVRYTAKEAKSLALEQAAALRTAADQLEAVRVYAEGNRYWRGTVYRDLLNILTADTAPQGDR